MSVRLLFRFLALDSVALFLLLLEHLLLDLLVAFLNDRLAVLGLWQIVYLDLPADACAGKIDCAIVSGGASIFSTPPNVSGLLVLLVMGLNSFCSTPADLQLQLVLLDLTLVLSK